MTENLVHLRGGEGRTLVCVHAAGGMITGFRRVSPFLNIAGPIVAFENIEPGPESLCSIQALAYSYWQQVKPYLTCGLDLVGWSFGGPVAVEMAGLAELDGYPVGTVVLLDSASPLLLRDRLVEPLSDVANLFEVELGDLPKGADPVGIEEALEIVVATLQVRQPGLTVDDLRPFTEIYSWHLSALRAGGPLQVPAATKVLIRAESEPGWSDAPSDLGWTQVLGETPDIRWAPGNHYSVVSQRHAPALAAMLNRVLAASSRTGES